ncbi:MAG: tryptophan-rich sensory protein [Candidatus Woesebacteria bacterium]|jgi:tryptophan-rich sensory protein
MKKIYWQKLIIALLLPQLAGLLASFFTSSSVRTWYFDLNKPFFNPPDWIFAPVWISLYLMMGLAFYLVWQGKSKKKFLKKAKIIFLLQLFFNFLWSIIFFGLQLPGLAFLEIILLWFLIVLTIRRFFLLNKSASYLLIPYLLWVSFASILNLAIVLLN